MEKQENMPHVFFKLFIQRGAWEGCMVDAWPEPSLQGGRTIED